MKEITLHADSVRINGPKIDGSLNVTFTIGEYEQSQVADLLKIPQQTIIKLIISLESDDQSVHAG